MKTRLLTEISAIEGLEDEWRGLAESRGNAFVTPEWFRSWWAHQADSSSPLIAAVHREDGSLAGVMPLVLDTSRRPRAIRFAGATLGDRFSPAAAEADEDGVAIAAMAALEAEGIDRHMLLLERVDTHRAWWGEMRKASTHGRSAVEQQRAELPYIPLDGLDWESYLAERSSNFRQQARRRDRALSGDHAVNVRTANAATLEADLASFFDLHLRRWRGRGGSSLEPPTAMRSLSEFAAAAEQRGWLRLRLLEVDGAAVAAFLGWRLGGRYAFYSSGFDPAWSKMSVGLVLLTRTIRSAIEEGAAEFDMLLGGEAYKQRFTAESRAVQTVVLTRAMSPTRLLVTGEASARRVGGRLIDAPGVGRLVRSLRRVLPTARRS